ncbi:MAG: enoyl-CoA hydratase [Alphaproteobacteria bacterium]|mgnify:CR=1 FL=1|nr:enoyl-CoA hydratase [Alphaproteobacteria bacterium]
MTYSEILLDVNDGVATVTLNRPEARNALGGTLRDDFAQVTQNLSERAGKDISAVVMAGAGKSFCAGGDLRVLKEMSAKGPEAMEARMHESHATLVKWLDLPVPTIAAVHGAAAGAGFSLAIACDFVFAAPSARFIMSFGRIGLVPDWGAMYLLPRLIGLQRAKDLVFTARDIDADAACEMGLVYELVAEDRLRGHAQEFAAKFTNASPEAIGMAKQIMGAALETDRATALTAEASAQATANASDYHRAAVERFLAKEPAIFNWES